MLKQEGSTESIANAVSRSDRTVRDVRKRCENANTGDFDPYIPLKNGRSLYQ